MRLSAFWFEKPNYICMCAFSLLSGTFYARPFIFFHVPLFYDYSFPV